MLSGIFLSEYFILNLFLTRMLTEGPKPATCLIYHKLLSLVLCVFCFLVPISIKDLADGNHAVLIYQRAGNKIAINCNTETLLSFTVRSVFNICKCLNL